MPICSLSIRRSLWDYYWSIISVNWHIGIRKYKKKYFNEYGIKKH